MELSSIQYAILFLFINKEKIRGRLYFQIFVTNFTATTAYHPLNKAKSLSCVWLLLLGGGDIYVFTVGWFHFVSV